MTGRDFLVVGLVLLLGVTLFGYYSFGSGIRSSGHMSLLAVSEGRNGSLEGNLAHLFVEIKPGTGRVFLDTFPITKLDTQLSARFAKEMACSYSLTDCSNLDFFYTIRSDSPTIGGPSAGAAMTALTIILLENKPQIDSVLITGTINSGGLIGPVGGYMQKIDAARLANATKVLVSQGSSLVEEVEPVTSLETFVNETIKTSINTSTNASLNYSSNSSIGNSASTEIVRITDEDSNSSNESRSPFSPDYNDSLPVDSFNVTKRTDLKEYAAKKGIGLVEVSDIGRALEVLTGEKEARHVAEIEISPYYKITMKSIATELCNRSETLLSVLSRESELTKLGKNLTSRARSEFSNENYYSAASRCFGANIRFKQEWYDEQNFSNKGFESEFDVVNIYKERLESALDDVRLETLTDLQTYIIVDERLLESESYLALSKDALSRNNSESADYYLAYAYERINSAKSWSRFFGIPGKKFVFDNKLLSDSCQQKLSEAEERMQYVNSFYPLNLKDSQKQLENAYKDKSREHFELCLFRASKVKAELDVLMSVMGVSDKNINQLLAHKLDIAKQKISEQSEKENFPILGYSYFEYSNALSKTDKYSALVYSEYALELSNLDLYFDSASGVKRNFKIDFNLLLLLFLGIVIGLVADSLIRSRQ